tara:strand:- start:189 stop:455 length:267 start_codon:yes stop_codon:yes gene_type:complete
MMKKTVVALSVAALSAGAVVLPAAAQSQSASGLMQLASYDAPNPCNPCAAKNPCNPCAAKNPCNPCAAKNPCAATNPCAAKNPCAPKS